MKMQRSRVAVWLAGMLALALGLAAGSARANNLQITNVTVTPRDTTTAWVQFDISWENSWRHANINHDAAWVFFKVLPDGRSAWEHVTLEGTGTNPTGYVTGSGTSIEMIVPADRVGMFVRRSGEGAGTNSVQNVKAVWNIASNSLAKTDKVKIQAFGVEMVYVAQGKFKVGDGLDDQGQFFEGGGGRNAFLIQSESAITTSNQVGCLWGASQAGNNSMGGDGVIPNAFPKGYAAFYCMQYEITQGQYADFQNVLTRDQQATRCQASTRLGRYMYSVGTLIVQKRNTVQLTTDPGSPAPRVYTTVTRDRACNWLSWADGCAFTDWAGLRPMTELEFEKACRGPLDPVADEYAWGNTNISETTAILNDGTGTETATNGNCNYHHADDPHKPAPPNGAPKGPYRVGIYAKEGSTRQEAGASYWGIMELSGNLWERPVTARTATGRLFTGLHGDGVLTSGGEADFTALKWPDATANGTGYRGGAFRFPKTEARVSDRTAAFNVLEGRRYDMGSRAMRSAPSGVGP